MLEASKAGYHHWQWHKVLRERSLTSLLSAKPVLSDSPHTATVAVVLYACVSTASTCLACSPLAAPMRLDARSLFTGPAKRKHTDTLLDRAMLLLRQQVCMTKKRQQCLQAVPSERVWVASFRTRMSSQCSSGLDCCLKRPTTEGFVQVLCIPGHFRFKYRLSFSLQSWFFKPNVSPRIQSCLCSPHLPGLALPEQQGIAQN